MASKADASPPWKRSTRSSSEDSMGPIAPDWTAEGGGQTRERRTRESCRKAGLRNPFEGTRARPGRWAGRGVTQRPARSTRSADLDPGHARRELELQG